MPADREPALPETSPKSPPIRWAAKLSAVVWWFLLVMLVLSALVVGVGRQLTSNLDAFRDDLTGALSARFGHEVSIGEIASQWDWLDPSFTARNISVANQNTGAIVARLQHLRIRLDFLSSLRRLRLVFEDFEADGLDLTLTQTRQGEIAVSGATLPEPANRRLQQWLELAGTWLSEPYVKITRFHLGLRDSQGNLREFDIPQLDLVYRRGLFRASGRAMQPGTTQQLASFSLVGQHFFRGDFTGQLYLGVDSGRFFDGLIDDYQWRSVHVEGFDLGGEAWLTFRDGILQRVSGSVETPYLQLGIGEESLAPLENIKARFGWRRQDSAGGAGARDSGATVPAAGHSGEWHLQQVQWQWDGDEVSPFSVRLKPSREGLTIIADALPLRPLRRLVSRLPMLPGQATEALENYRPSGFLDRMELHLPQHASGFQLSGQLRDVSVNAYQGAPSVAGLFGRLYLDETAGYVKIESAGEAVRLGFPALFRADWSFSGLDGLVAWSLEDAVTRVYSDNLRMAYGEGVVLQGAFDLKLQRDGEDNLGLRVGVENGKAAMLADFVPKQVVDPGLYEWLTGAITGADINSGVYYGHGQIGAGAPSGSFVSSMWYEFSNASVRYDERWPAVTEASGRVVVHNGNTRVTLAGAETGGLTLAPSTVRVVPGNDGPRVLVDAEAGVPGSAADFWLTNSPLGAMAGSEAQKLGFDGSYRLNLGLDLPLASDRPATVEARVRAQGGSVSYQPANLTWRNLRGELTYHSVEGFSGEPVAASFLGKPVKIRLSRSGAGKALAIRQSGQLAMPSALAEAGLGSGAGYGLEGTLAYTAELEVGADSTSAVTVRSDLSGLKVGWPEALGKSADEAAPLALTVDPSAAGGIAVRGQWQDRLSFDLLWKPTGFDLLLKQLQLGTTTVRDSQIDGLDLGDRWVVNVESEPVLGRIVIPDDEATIIGDFERLTLMRGDAMPAEASPTKTFEQKLAAFRSLGMGRWPDLDITIGNLNINQETLGRWAFQVRPEPYRLVVDNIEGRLGSLTLLGDMDWTIVGDREVSRFSGSVTGGAIADLKKLFGTDIPLSNESSKIELDLDWPGRPDEFALAGVSGTVNLRLDNGMILEQNNSAQVFRVFNLLNSDTLWRRLKLDFSDLYERGVAFDAISGKAQITDGVVTLAPELQVVGPSGAFKLSGTTDIADENLDMRLVVVLPLTQNLPLAALLMGASAPIGGALFVLDKILGDPLSKLTSATYAVTGTWDEPKVELRRVFDTGE